MSKRSRGRVSRTLRKIAKKAIKRANKRRAMRVMYAKGKRMKKINYPTLKTNGIMVTA